MPRLFAGIVCSIGVAITACTVSSPAVAQSLLNVSFDPTRELYTDVNAKFTDYWKNKTGQTVNIRMSHGGSGKQSRAVIDGLEADVVTLALPFDIDALAVHGQLLAPAWRDRLPEKSAPYLSTIVFLVRKGNPKGLKDWDDLVKEEVGVITPNPKTSGGARWNYLAAWAFAAKKFNNDEPQVKDFMRKLFKNVPVLDSGARGSTTTFVQRELGDVLLAWEMEAYRAKQERGGEDLEIVYPSLTVKAEPAVAVVDKNVEKHGSKELAEEYLKFLYTPEAQEIVARNFFRPTLQSIAEKHKSTFPAVSWITVEEIFGSWEKAHAAHFADGGTFDAIYEGS